MTEKVGRWVTGVQEKEGRVALFSLRSLRHLRDTIGKQANSRPSFGGKDAVILHFRELEGMEGDLRTEEGHAYAVENQLFQKICEKCIVDSVRIVEELTAPASI
jgi:hypothetical protein